MPAYTQENVPYSSVKNALKRLVLVMFIPVCSIAETFSQCTITTATAIPDNEIVTLGFNISGLANSSLASPAQGICGVEISFNHQLITDLTVTLISPAGTQVQLIGPAIPTMNFTQLTSWNVQFVPCSSPANPDAGFNNVWSNTDGWASIASYSGNYYPHLGCLEDFNVGSANGQWLLVVEDHEQFDLGNILEVTLIFCDPTGLECDECLPNGGTLSPASFSRCAGQNILSSEITVDFGNNHPSSSLYDYEFVLLSGNFVMQHGSAFSATPPPGNYMLCGLSYLLADSSEVKTSLDLGDWGGIIQDILTGQICADSSNCIPLVIMAPPDTMRVTGQICQGESFDFGGQSYTTIGTFYQTHDGPGICDSIIEIRVGPRMLDVTITDPDILVCSNPSITLMSNVTGANGPFMYNWTTTFGNITSANNIPTITVDQAGPYNLSVTDGICSGVNAAIVQADIGFPQIFVNGATLTCDVTNVSLNPVYIPSDGTVLWTGPNGFMDTNPNIIVSEPGIYELTITNALGCSSTKQAMVGLDTTTSAISIYEHNRYCPTNQVQFGVATSMFINTYAWTGPNGFVSDSYAPFVVDGGTYNLVATFNNGCQRSISYDFSGDFTIPDIQASPNDTLNCGESIPLTVSSNTPGATYYWTLPLGNFAFGQTFNAQEAGIYQAIVVAPNGCNNSQQIEIVAGPDIFSYSTIIDTLMCRQPVVTVGVVSAQADLYHWDNIAPPNADSSFVDVINAGIYTVTMIDTNSQCTLTATLVVPSDLNPPDFDIIYDTISCLDPIGNATFAPVPGFTYANVFWELPDLTRVQGPVIASSMPGVYNLHAIAPNGCEKVEEFEFAFDTLPPYLLIQSDSLICDDTATIKIQSLDMLVSISWTGPGILNDIGGSIDVTKAGFYNVETMGVNGCISSVEVLVDSNYLLPEYMIFHDTLRCDTSATLSVLTNDSIIQYQWFDPVGILIAPDSTVEVNSPGPYTVQIQGSNRCIAHDTIILKPVTYPVIDITSDTLTCIDTIVTLVSHIDVQPNAIRWINAQNDTIGINATVDVRNEGPYYLQVTGPNGCISHDTISVPYDTISPNAAIMVIGEVRCMERDVILDGGGSTPSGLLFDWSTIGGTITSDPSQPLIDALDSGRYQLIVTRLDNGCKDTAEYHLLVSPDEIHSVTLDIVRPVCSGENNGAISITGVTGGVGTFVFQLEDGPVEDDSLFNDLSAGSYLLAVFDQTGCEYDTLVSIPATTDYSVDAGPDVEIHLGETVTLSGTTTLPDSSISDQVWDSLGISLCALCPQFETSPWVTTSYLFSVISETGCVMTDEMTVFVVEKGKFYIANIFSPNGDGINDEVRIGATPGIAKVLQWIIFDRWGNAVYGRTDFDPGDPSVFWNGQTTTGEFANPGVFPYLLEIQLINGSKELLHGNITLLR